MRVVYGFSGMGCPELRERLCLCGVMEEWGGGALCEIVGEEVLDEAFPGANDGVVVEGLLREKMVQGLLRWVGLEKG